MRCVFRFAILSLGMLLVNASWAEPMVQEPYGVYISLFGGVASTPEVTGSVGSSATGKVRYHRLFSGTSADNLPFHFGVGLGYKNGPFRYEAVFQFMRSKYLDLTTGGSKVSGFSGDTQVVAGMANLFYDFDQFHTDSGWVMYLGGGAGYADVENEAKFSTASLNTSASQGLFALQGIAGMGYHFCQEATMFFDYRYFFTPSKVDFTGKRYQNHLFTVGLNIYIKPQSNLA